MADTLLGMEQLILWVRATSTTLGAAVTGTSETSITLTSAASTTAASSTLPVVAEIDNERMAITTSGTTPTVTRAWDHSTAATHSNGATVKLLRPVRVYKTSDWTPNIDLQDIAVPGDGTVEHIFRMQGLSGALTASKWSDDVLIIAMGVPEVTTGVGLPQAVSSMLHPQEGTYPLVQMTVRLVMLDGDNSDATSSKYLYLWQCKLQDPFVPGAAGNNGLQATPINWNANPVTTDLFGRAIPGVTADIHYSIGSAA
jgi:hypothetical protein